MKIVDGMFQVNKGENVTISITPSFSAGNQIVAVRDGDATKDLFDFKVTKNSGQEHAVEIVFGFLGAADGAQYKVVIDGDADDNEGPFTRFVRKSSVSHRRLYEFLVA